MEREEEEKARGFKVEDRRRFSSEGEIKPEFRDDSPAAAPSAAGHGQTTPESAYSPKPNRATQAAAAPQAHRPEPEVTFGAFLVGLSTQALMLLGDIADPETGATHADLPGAQQLIDIIGMLQRKTQGNLDHDEAQLIETILFELRMKYVERARATTR
jgi:hypothetical protein